MREVPKYLVPRALGAEMYPKFLRISRGSGESERRGNLWISTFRKKYIHHMIEKNDAKCGLDGAWVWGT
jgi:hypothetical protein